ncbi:MAG TPA: response regulator [Chryseolinea sp.]|nr:response regulator [Chryseolinea sp.]
MTTKRNVMVVDDDDLVHLISKKILSAYACISHVYSAYNGKEALELLHRSCEGAIKIPAVVLLDLHMPVMNGFQFMEEVKQMDCLKGSKVVTVMFSSTIDPREIEQAQSLGIEYFFSKPIVMEKIETVFKREFC